MIGVIANPKKTIVVDFSIDKVKVGIERINKISRNKYSVTKSNPIFNQTTLEATEFLSLGVFIDINLSSINENKTEITVEVRRKIGAFDQAHEITKANKHIELIFEIIGRGISLSDIQFSKLLESKVATNTNSKKKSNNALVFGVVVFVIILVLLVNFFSK